MDSSNDSLRSFGFTLSFVDCLEAIHYTDDWYGFIDSTLCALDGLEVIHLEKTVLDLMISPFVLELS